MHLDQLLQPALGVLGMVVSFVIAQVNEAFPESVRPWIEGGAYLALVGFLAFAGWTFWKKLNERDKEIAELNLEIRKDWKAQNDRLIQVLEKLDPDEKG